jgi:hypothetical protein
MAPKKERDTGEREKRQVPRPSTVVEEFEIKSPKGRKYAVKRTNQKDVYDKETPEKDKPKG